jgi:hypothetical protein
MPDPNRSHIAEKRMAKRVKSAEFAWALKWTEARVARTIIHSKLFGRQLVIVPNTNWAGHESDLLAVDPRNLKLVEIEIKVSLADLRADADKEKWWTHSDIFATRDARVAPREHLERIWKHYYAVPNALLGPAFVKAVDRIPRTSGILALSSGAQYARVLKRCVPNRKAEPITEKECVDLARLCGLRMWDALLREESK